MSEPFGPYLLEQRLAAGGMAEVFLGRKKAGEDARRWCVVKRMLPHIAADPHFAAMFLDEARLAAQLNHPGIAQLYDFGRADEQLYLAMEYVAGATLRGVVKDHAKRNAKIPLRPAVEIVARAADALDYAHRATDLAGKPLNLIHRDVSPQNILLSLKGEVKLIDFGVAKAATASQVTAEGVIKGKFPYMSPEQIRGQPLDHRSDLFGLGFVLYELLAGKRAITGATDVEISQNALAMRYAPIEESRPDVPPALKALLARALEKERKKRFQTAGELAAALRGWLQETGPSPTSQELAAILPAMERPPPPPIDLTGTGQPAAPTEPVPALLEPTAPVRPQLPPPPPSFWDTPAPAPVATLDASQKPTALADDSEVRRILAGKQPLRQVPPPAASPASAPVLAPPMPPPVPPAALRTDDGPGSGSASRVRRAVRRATLPWILSAVVLAAGLAVLLIAVATESRRNPGPAPAQPPPAAGGSAGAAALQPAVLLVDAAPQAAVSVDGQARGRTPLELSLAPGEHTLVFEDPSSGKRHTRKLTLKEGEARTEKWQRGFLSVRAIPYGEVFVDGEPMGVTPLPPLELEAGKHRLLVKNAETKKENAREIEVFPGAEVVVKVDLR